MVVPKLEVGIEGKIKLGKKAVSDKVLTILDQLLQSYRSCPLASWAEDHGTDLYVSELGFCILYGRCSLMYLVSQRQVLK